MMKNCTLFSVILIVGIACTPVKEQPAKFYLPVKVERTTVKQQNTPCELEVDFSELLNKMNVTGKFDRHSVIVEGKDPSSGKFTEIDYRVGENFKYGTSGKIYWLIENLDIPEYRICFAVETEKPREPRSYIPAIGVGDEILYNVPDSVPPIAMSANLLIDYDGDGITDVLAINHYSDRYGWPYDGILFHPGIREDGEGILIRDFYRIRYIPVGADDNDLRPLHARYNWVCPVDWDDDGLIDLMYISIEREEIHQLTMPENVNLFQSSTYITYLRNTGRKDISGLPILRETKHYPALVVTKDAYVPSLAAEDIDGDGLTDLIGIRSGGGALAYFFRNIGYDASGIPKVAEPIKLMASDGKPVRSDNTAHDMSFGDVNDDGKIDVICNNVNLNPPETYWYENKGGSPPLFEFKSAIKGLPFDRRGYRWVQWKGSEGLLGKEGGALLIRTIVNGEPVFTEAGMLREIYGPMVGGSQEKPEWIDWDDDGDIDLLAGEAWGRIHLYENIGSKKKPMFKQPVWIQADGKDIRIYRDGVFGGRHWHGAMGYPSVACVDWDRDGLFDLMVPNETNRVYWFRNIGVKGKPRFGKRIQILPDGFTDSKEKLEQTRLKAINDVYVLEENIPFSWRTRLAIADYTGDGLEDIIALNGMKNLVLYERYRDASGKLRLKSDKQLFYNNEKAIEKPHYSKIRNVDWDGDGLIDLVATQSLFSRDQRSLIFLKNVGTEKIPVFERPKAFKMWNRVITYSSHGLQPSFLDWDGDGSLDFVGCNESGFFVLFRNAVLTQPKPKLCIGEPVVR